MVGTALKPHYRAKTINKDQFTEINRTISRMLYERVGTVETLEPKPRADIEEAAKSEVQKSIDGLCRESTDKHRRKQKQKQPIVASDSDGDSR